MSFKYRFALLFSLSVFIILTVSAIYILVLNEEFRRSEFYQRLRSEGEKVSELYFKKGYSGEQARNQLTLMLASVPEEQVVILDSSQRVLYANIKRFRQPMRQDAFAKAQAEGRYFFTDNRREFAILYMQTPMPHFIISSGFDRYGRSKADNLLVILIFSVIGGLVLAAFLSFLYVRELLKPLNQLKVRIEQINEENLTEKLDVRGSSDELNVIAKNFNAMLDRLEEAFETRRSFVQHASHELRTPLANMLSQTEVALNQQLDKDQYRSVLQSLKEDQQDMISLTNSLLLLSQYETQTKVDDWKTIRIDELMYETIDITKNVYRNAVISVDFEELPEDEVLLEFRGNEMLIKSAFQNLIRNACNYSEDNLVTITINAQPSHITIYFNNRGRQLNADEQERLFIPFFRGDNSITKKGFGLGLSIVQRILTLHRAKVSYQAIEPDLNRFIVVLPHNH